MIEIPGYDEFEPIGRGGFATVYRARQISVGRQVAIKVLSDPSPDADLLRRFERESKAVGALSWHPHIAAVVDAGTTPDGRAYIVFELLTGGSLDALTASVPLAWNDAVGAMIQVADAVEAAHREDVLHRDIKPANILLNRLGDAKLADFGIASMQDGNKTETGMLATTVAHAAPELFDGQPASVATDIYAMGSTLHTLVTGRAPFVPAEGMQIATIIKAIATQPPPVPDPSVVPPAVANVIAHALAKHPDYRPATASAFGKALQDVQRRSGVTVTPMPVGDSDPAGADPTIVATPPPEASLPAPGWESVTPPPAPLVPESTPGPLPAPPPSPTPPVPAAQPPQPPQAAAPATAAPATRPPVPTRAPVAAPVAASQRKPFSRTIRTLVALAILAALAFGGALLWPTLQGPTVLSTTAGGARILSVKATPETQIEGFPAEAAVDGNDETSWGIAPNVEAEQNIAGSTFTIRLEEPVLVTRVGITNGSGTRLGRVSHLTWGTSIDDIRSRASTNVVQELTADAGDQLVDFGLVTDTIAIVITDVHDVTAPDAGIAEILLVVDEP